MENKIIESVFTFFYRIKIRNEMNFIKEMFKDAIQAKKYDEDKIKIYIVSGEQDPYVYSELSRVIKKILKRNVKESNNIEVNFIAGSKLMSNKQYITTDLKRIHPTFELLDKFNSNVKLFIINQEKSKRLPFHFIYCNYASLAFAELPHTELVNTLKWTFFNKEEYPEKFEKLSELIKTQFEALQIIKFDKEIIKVKKYGAKDFEEMNNDLFKQIFIKKIDFIEKIRTRKNNLVELEKQIKDFCESTNLNFENWFYESMELFSKKDNLVIDNVALKN